MFVKDEESDCELPVRAGLVCEELQTQLHVAMAMRVPNLLHVTVTVTVPKSRRASS